MYVRTFQTVARSNIDVYKIATARAHISSLLLFFSRVWFLSTSVDLLRLGLPRASHSFGFHVQCLRDCHVSYRSLGKLSKCCHRQGVLTSKLTPCPVLTLPRHLFFNSVNHLKYPAMRVQRPPLPLCQRSVHLVAVASPNPFLTGLGCEEPAMSAPGPPLWSLTRPLLVSNSSGPSYLGGGRYNLLWHRPLTAASRLPFQYG